MREKTQVVLFSRAGGEVSRKIVYWGCAQSGKTSNLLHIRTGIGPDSCAEIVKVPEGGPGDHYEFLSASTRRADGLRTQLHLYAVSAHSGSADVLLKLLPDTDAIVFVTDSKASRMDANITAFLQLWDSCRTAQRPLTGTSLVLQLNKRDEAKILSVSHLDALFNHTGSRLVESCAWKGIGVMETLATACGQRSAETISYPEPATFDREGGAQFSFVAGHREPAPAAPSMLNGRHRAPRFFQEPDPLVRLLRDIGWLDDC